MRVATIARRPRIGAVLTLAVSLVLLSVAFAQAQTQSGAKIAFHAQLSSKSLCVDGAALAAGTDCATYTTSGLSLNTMYYVYVVVAGNDGPGLGGVRFGIDCDAATGSGVDIDGWTSCGNLDYPNTGPNGAWPAPGSGNHIVFGECQQSVPSGGSYAQGVGGVLYVYAYDDDVLEATPDRTDTCYGELTVSDCSGNDTDLTGSVHANVLGGLGFGTQYGSNPCNTVADGAICGVSESVLDFGTVELGGSRDLTVRIQDVGFGLGLPAFSVGPFSGGDFTIVSGEGDYESPVQDPVDVTFRFTPGGLGAQEATFEVNPCTLCPPITLKGTGDFVVPAKRTTWGKIKNRYQ